MSRNKSVYINDRQYKMLKESEWNYHFGSNHDMRPYVSDNKYQTAGRETGHFGSGTYFSTYKGMKDIDDYGVLNRNQNPNFIEIKDHVYRVDFDIYRNLYRVRSKKQGDVLYTMLANLNHMANKIAYMGNFSSQMANYSNSRLYQEIRSNADGLGLRCPSYYELTRMAQRLGKDSDDIRSFSTVFMEWNGYNGVNVSGVDYYDNTKHGSVIYDLSKVDSDMEEVSPKNLYCGYGDCPYDDSVVQNGFYDYNIEALKGKYINWVDKLNDMPLVNALRILKNYTDSGNVLNYFYVKDLNSELIKRYLRILFIKKPKGYWNDPISDEVINGDCAKYYARLIDEYGAYYWVNYEGSKRYDSILVNLLSNFAWNLPWSLDEVEERKKKEEYLNKLLSYMQRELSEYEKSYIKEEYLEEGEDGQQED